LVFPDQMYADLVASHASRGKDKTKEKLQGVYDFKEKSLDALYTAFEEVVRKEDKTIHTLVGDQISTFTRIKNKWGDIRDAIV
jgi:hypothetical protein